MKPLVVILGPTASGKSNLAVYLAKKFGGEIVSADSRQVYKEIPIGSGIIPKKQRRTVLHHLLGIVSLKKKFDVAQYQKKAFQAISQIHKKRKLPFLVGGSALYLYAIADGFIFPQVKPDRALRRKLEKLSTKELWLQLKKLYPQRASTIEKENPRRLIRAIEIVMQTKKPVPLLKKHFLFSPLLFIGMQRSPQELKKAIRKRVEERLKSGWIQETKKLLRSGISEKQIREIGLGYQWMLLFLKRQISRKELIERIQKAEMDFARRQMSWFKKDSRIHWIKNPTQAETLIHKFVTST